MIRPLPTLIALSLLVLPAGCSQHKRSERSEDPATVDDEPPDDAVADEPEDEDEDDSADKDEDDGDTERPIDSGVSVSDAMVAKDAESQDATQPPAPDAGESADAHTGDATAALDASAEDAAAAELDARIATDAADVESAVEAGDGDAALGADAAESDPACGADDDVVEPNGSFARLILLGSTNFNTGAYYELGSCLGDVDYLLIGHLGGRLSVAATGEVDLQVLPAMVDEAATRADYLSGERRVHVSASGSALSAFESVPAGFYLLRVAGKTRARALYSLALSHGCEGDGYDTPGVVDTSSFATVLTPRMVTRFDQPYAEAPEPTSAKLCAGDVDAFQFRAQKAGAALIELGNAANIRATVTQLSATGVESALTGLEESVNAGTRSVRVANLDPALTYVVRVAEISPSATTQNYTFRVRFDYQVVANDVCSMAQELPVRQTLTSVEADNIGTKSNVTSVCNGDAESTDPLLLGRDVFYWVRLTTRTSVSFDLASLIGDDAPFGSTTLYAAPGAICPSTFDQLLPLGYDGRQAPNAQQVACANERLRISDVPAGDYLLVVDGSAGYGGHGFVAQPTQGKYKLSTQAFARGFPAPEVCNSVAEIMLPARGSSASYQVTAAVESTEAFTEYGACTQYQAIHGGERVITFTATQSGTLSVRSAGLTGSSQAPYFDSVLAIAQGACRAVSPTAFMACSDDNAQSLDSEITASVRAGERYFVVVDHWFTTGDPLHSPTIVTFSLQ